MLFHDNFAARKVVIKSDTRGSVIIDRLKFVELEPRYRLPDRMTELYFDGRVYWVAGNGTQMVADQFIPRTVIGGFIDNIDKFKPYAETPPVTQVEESPDRWQKLETALRDSPAWRRVYLAMRSTTRGNAAGTLIMNAITATHNLNDLTAGWLDLNDAMQTQSSLEPFTPEEILYIRTALVDAGFDPKPFRL